MKQPPYLTEGLLENIVTRLNNSILETGSCDETFHYGTLVTVRGRVESTADKGQEFVLKAQYANSGVDLAEHIIPMQGATDLPTLTRDFLGAFIAPASTGVTPKEPQRLHCHNPAGSAVPA